MNCSTCSARFCSERASCAWRAEYSVAPMSTTATAALADTASLLRAMNFGRGSGGCRAAPAPGGNQVTLDVVEQRVHRGITIRGFLLERLEHHGVEIAAQRGAARASATTLGSGGSVCRMASSSAPRESRCSLYGRCAQQLVQNHAQRIHVGSNGERLAENLLGRGVVRRHGAARELGEPRLACLAVFQQLGDAEIQQPHLALGSHQDVRGLQIAVHHQLAVRIGHGLGGLRKQFAAAALPRAGAPGSTHPCACLRRIRWRGRAGPRP